MAISFPLNPNIGDEYSASGKSWTWNGSQWEGVSATSGIPFGGTSDRPTDAPGQPFFNGDEARLELFTSAAGWQNIVQETPAVVSIFGAYYEQNPSNTITINGTNFAVGAVATAIGTNGVEIQADTTTLVSVVEISATFSGLLPIHEPYDIKVTNPSNLFGVLYETLQIDDIPVFLTQSGSLGTYIEQSPMSVQISATDEESSNLVFSVSSGTLPAGLTLNPATGLISGTPDNILTLSNVSNFVVSVTDGNQSVSRNYSISISDRGPSWQSISTMSPFSKNVAYSETLVAADDDGVSGYSLVSGSLPTGLSLNQSTGEISGTPTSDTDAIFTIRATDISGNVADRQFTLPNLVPVWTSPTNLPAAKIGDPYSYVLEVSDDNIDFFELVSGSLPTGLTLNTSTGTISGTPTVAGISTFTIAVTDANSETVSKTFEIESAAIGQVLYSTPGNFSWTAPSGVTSVSVVAVGGGGAGASGNSGHAGGGGGLGWRNNITVVPGNSYTVVVGAGGPNAVGGNPGTAGGVSYFINTGTVAGYGGAGGTIGGEGGNNNTPQPQGGSFVGEGGGNGGNAGFDNWNYAGPGGGGAGGYTGSGGEGGGHWNSSYNGQSGSGGGGGGGSSGYNASGQGAATGGGGAGGGGVGVYGEGLSGAGGQMSTASTYEGGRAGLGGSGGTNGDNGISSSHGGNGGSFGAGGGGTNGNNDGGGGGDGAVRIIWGPNRLFPSTNTQDL